MDINFFVPTKIFTGKNCILNNSAVFAERGRKCIIVTGKNSAEKSGALCDVKTVLKTLGTEFLHYDGIEQNPSYETCKKAAALAADFGAEYVIGIGGGSPLDAAKAVAVLAADKNADEAKMYSCSWNFTPLPVIAVGITAGTGSEVTAVSVITDSNGLKKSFRDERVYPAAAFGDPTYTMSLSEEFTRSTAVDALCHCVESYFNRTSNEISRCFAVRGVQILAEMLKKTAGKTELSYDDREKLYCASLYGGLAISVTGTAFPHAMGYFLTERHGIAHGSACGAYFESFIEYNISVSPDEAKAFFDRVGTDAEKLCGLVRRNLSENVLKLKLTNDEIIEILPRFENNKSFKKCPGTADKILAQKILTKLFNQKA